MKVSCAATAGDSGSERKKNAIKKISKLFLIMNREIGLFKSNQHIVDQLIEKNQQKLCVYIA